MSSTAGHALAPSFVHTTESPDIRLTFTSGTSPVDVTIPSGTYRMCLAPSASDFLRVIQSRINTALGVASRSETVSVSLSSAGIFTLTVSPSTDFGSLSFPSDFVRFALGFSAAPASGSPVVGDYPVWYLALLTAGTGNYWQPKQSGGSERTNGGIVYTFASPATSWDRSLKVHFQPTTPDMRTAHGCEASPMYPAEAYMGAIGSTATARQWSVLDVLFAARNALCGYTSTWSTGRTSTTEVVWRAYVAPAVVLSTPSELLRPEWLAYTEWGLDLVAPSSTPTETRA